MAERITNIIAENDDETKYGPIRFFDGRPLLRSQDTDPHVFKGLRNYMIVAIAVGCLALIYALYSIIIAPMNVQSSVKANIEQYGSALSIPILMDFIYYSDGDIQTYFADQGRTIIVLDSDDSGSNGADMFCIPPHLDEASAQTMLNTGISNLSANDASLLLAGSWRMTTDRSYGVNYRVRYVDFSTTDINIAIDHALYSQGWSGATVSNSGVDDNGNTYREGTIGGPEGRWFTWRVSSIPLKSVYNVGLPENTPYVGIRISEN